MLESSSSSLDINCLRMTEFVTKKATTAKNTDVNNFQSFKFVIFKYPNEPNGKT